MYVIAYCMNSSYSKSIILFVGWNSCWKNGRNPESKCSYVIRLCIVCTMYIFMHVFICNYANKTLSVCMHVYVQRLLEFSIYLKVYVFEQVVGKWLIGKVWYRFFGGEGINGILLLTEVDGWVEIFIYILCVDNFSVRAGGLNMKRASMRVHERMNDCHKTC